MNNKSQTLILFRFLDNLIRWTWLLSTRPGQTLEKIFFPPSRAFTCNKPPFKNNDKNVPKSLRSCKVKKKKLFIEAMLLYIYIIVHKKLAKETLLQLVFSSHKLSYWITAKEANCQNKKAAYTLRRSLQIFRT